MGKLFKAAIGFAIALTLLNANAFWAGLDGRAVHDLRVAIAHEDPYGRLGAMAGEGAAALSARFGTATSDPRARRLHP
jgi:hypothetical protein